MKIMLFIFVFLLTLLSATKFFLDAQAKKFETAISGVGLPPPFLEEAKFLDFQEFRLHYFISGHENKETILFLHAAYADHTAFALQAAYLSAYYKIITLDLPGHGQSQPVNSAVGIENTSEMIHELLKKEGVSKVHVVGVSLGTLIGQDFIYRFPAYASTFVSVGGYDIHGPSEVLDMAKSAQGKEIFSMLVRAALSMPDFRAYVAKGTAISKTGQAKVYYMAKSFTRSSFKVMKNFQKIIYPSAQTLNIPLLIINGALEKEKIALELSRHWHHRIKGSRYEVIEHAGHCANLDQPDIFNKLVLEFIQSNDDAKF